MSEETESSNQNLPNTELDANTGKFYQTFEELMPVQ